MNTPAGWTSFHLKDVTDESRTRAVDENALMLPVFGVNNQTGLDTNSKYYAEELDRYKIVKRGMFAYNPMRLNIGSIGYCHESLGQGLVSPDYVVFSCKETDLVPKYLYYCIQSHHWKEWMKRAGAGSVRVRIYYEHIGVYPIMLPSLAEQKKIVKILSAWDDAIALTEQLIISKQQVKQGVMQQVLSGQIRFKGFKEPWERKPIKEICDTFSGGTPDRSNSAYFGGDIPWIKSGEVNQRLITQTEETLTTLGYENSSAKFIEPNTVLIAMYGATAGVVGISKIRATTNQAVLAIVPKNTTLETNFLYHELSYQVPEMLKKLQGAQPNLSGNLIRNSFIDIPSKAEQIKISAILSTIDEEIDLLNQKLERLSTQKKGLLQRLLTGETRVKV